MNSIWAFVLLVFLNGAVLSQERSATIHLDFNQKAGPLDIHKMGLAQGGLSDESMFENRIPEIRALAPELIRIFVQEYYGLLPKAGEYDFTKLDRTIDAVTRAGAKPLMSIDVKPHVLFPVIDENVVEPNDYAQWEELIVQLVRHYKDRGAGIRYWEVANEPDMGEAGGCPYRFKPDSYVRYYKHTAAAILRADPDAKVGGPALANWKSPILPALLDAAAKSEVPLDFVSWHTYDSDPLSIRGTIHGVKEMVKQRPSLHPELVLDEWNMSLGRPVQDPRFQPCFAAETIWQMIDSGLDYSNYYHIRDYGVEARNFSGFMSAQGVAFMARWWNRMPQYDGLFDYQNTVRPAYFALKLISRMSGERLGMDSSDAKVHGFLVHDSTYLTDNLLLWNFSDQPVKLQISGWPAKSKPRRLVLNAVDGNDDENLRLKPTPPMEPIVLGPWGIEFWYSE
jgi:xylan 1,4-beta-xylosidase